MCVCFCFDISFLMLSDQKERQRRGDGKKSCKSEKFEKQPETLDERLFTGVVLNNTTMFILRTLFDNGNGFAAKTSSLMCQ